jgi:hypothetical protein
MTTCSPYSFFGKAAQELSPIEDCGPPTVQSVLCLRATDGTQMWPVSLVYKSRSALGIGPDLLPRHLRTSSNAKCCDGDVVLAKVNFGCSEGKRHCRKARTSLATVSLIWAAFQKSSISLKPRMKIVIEAAASTGTSVKFSVVSRLEH